MDKRNPVLVPIILAAGASERMGTPKPLLDFEGTACLDVVLAECLQAGLAKPIVVLGYEAERIRARCKLSKATVVVNGHYERGQTSSIQTGLEALPPSAAGFLIFPVDYPLVTARELNRLAEAYTSAGVKKIWLPTYEGKRGHPALFDKTLADEFLRLAPDEPAHAVVRHDPTRVQEIPFDAPPVVRSMNTPEEYAALLVAYQKARRVSSHP